MPPDDEPDVPRCEEKYRRLPAGVNAARDYAAVIASVGIDPTEAIRIIEAALGHPSSP